MLNWDEFELPITAPRFGEGAGLYVRRGRQSAPESPVTLVFLHEALGSIAQWRDFPQQLAERCGCDVLIYERIGHAGASSLELPRPDDYLVYEGEVVLPQLLERLEIEQAVLVGHSDGGSIALVGAASVPDRVRGVITEAAHLLVEPITRDGIIQARDLYDEAIRPGLSRYHGDKTDTLFQGWWQTWLRDSFQGLDLSPWLGRIRAPSLIMQGVNDQYGSALQVEKICEGIGAQASPCWLDAAHIPHREATEPCLEAMGGFIRRLLNDQA
ncbi:alpha/beta fold hydrolase [Motiliproteus sp.]|uniref:alpha/beta fold hydrolase n=1 Tax=Motiliproteus sp. TaxID=1898955 RepID=UPI003BAD0382